MAAVERGREVLRISQALGLAQERVVADVEGGVVLYFFGGAQMDDGGWRLQSAWMVSNEGEACLYFRDRSQLGSETEDLSPRREALQGALERIRSFLKSA